LLVRLRPRPRPSARLSTPRARGPPTCRARAHCGPCRALASARPPASACSSARAPSPPPALALHSRCSAAASRAALLPFSSSCRWRRCCAAARRALSLADLARSSFSLSKVCRAVCSYHPTPTGCGARTRRSTCRGGAWLALAAAPRAAPPRPRWRALPQTSAPACCCSAAAQPAAPATELPLLAPALSVPLLCRCRCSAAAALLTRCEGCCSCSASAAAAAKAAPKAASKAAAKAAAPAAAAAVAAAPAAPALLLLREGAGSGQQSRPRHRDAKSRRGVIVGAGQARGAAAASRARRQEDAARPLCRQPNRQSARGGGLVLGR
jgi:hypothetical protein